MAQKQKPVNEIRLGRIQAAIWANQTEQRDVWFNVTVTRLYKEGDQWKDTTTFRRDDTPTIRTTSGSPPRPLAAHLPSPTLAAGIVREF